MQVCRENNVILVNHDKAGKSEGRREHSPKTSRNIGKSQALKSSESMRLNIYGGGERLKTRKSHTRESRCVDVTNARFVTRVSARARGERRRERKLRVALIHERVDCVKDLRV